MDRLVDLGRSIGAAGRRVEEALPFAEVAMLCAAEMLDEDEPTDVDEHPADATAAVLDALELVIRAAVPCLRPQSVMARARLAALLLAEDDVR